MADFMYVPPSQRLFCGFLLLVIGCELAAIAHALQRFL